MKLKIKKLHPNAVIPQYAKPGDAGLDLVATSLTLDENNNLVYGTGLAIEIPTGYVGLLFPRSSNSKKDLILSNHVGVIDSGYRGEIIFKYKSSLCSSGQYITGKNYEVGDKVGQLILFPYSQVTIEEVEELTETERGTNGFGSTGK